MGGRKNRHYVDADETKFVAPTTPQEVRTIMSQVMVDVHAGKLDPRRAVTMNSVAATLLKAMEITELQQRLLRLEEGREDRSTASPGPHSVADLKPS